MKSYGRIVFGVLFAGFALSAAFGQGDLVMLAFEGSDTASIKSGEASTEQFHGGKTSWKWANHPTNKGLSVAGFPTDWSGYDILSFWMYSGAANDAEFMLLVNSENPGSEGGDYWGRKIKVDWTGWKHLEIPFGTLPKTRSPLGWDKITAFGFTVGGWGIEPKADTVLYLDDVELRKTPSDLRNAGFEDGGDGSGVPVSWHLFPVTPGADVRVEVVPEGRTGKAVKIVDKDPKNGVGIQQFLAAQPGKTYKLSCWKKGAAVGLYLKWQDAARKDAGLKNATATNTVPDAFEEFSVSEKCPEGAKFVVPWIYSYTMSQGEVVVDDVKLEISD